MTGFSDFSRKLGRALRRHGVIRFCSLAFGKLILFGSKLRPSIRAEDREREQRALEFDKRFGVDTAGIIHQTHLEKLGPNQLHAVSYGASDPRSFLRAMNALPLAERRYVFVDFGSGKGRAILMATEFPFKKIIGVEFSKELNNIASENIMRFRRETAKCLDIEAIWMDVVDYDLPKDDLICYFCNPFDAVLMERVMSNIRASLLSNPRDIYVGYYNPLHPEAIDRTGCFKRVSHIDNILIWRSDAASGTSSREADES
jgi:SAM-dependent methyltransferase